MSELTLSQFWIIIGSLMLVCIFLVFLLTKYKHDIQELTLDLNKTILDFNQLAEKFDTLNIAKQQLEQQWIKEQTQAENLLLRISERDNKIIFVETELNEAQARNEQLVLQLNGAKERLGMTSAQLEGLQAQLMQNQQRLDAKENEQQNLTEKMTALSQELVHLKTMLAEKEKHFTEQKQNIEQSRQQLSTEFQNLANRILEEKSRTFSQTNQSTLETMLKPFREQIESFQKRVNEIHSESLKGNAGLESEIKKVLEIGFNMSKEANNLASALKGKKKTLGNWGEIQLEQALQSAGLIENQHYQSQAHFKNAEGKHNYPDFVLHLPDNKHLIIDSKMSLNAYESAVNSDDELQARSYLNEHIKALKNHIDDLARKDYSNLIGMHSPDFVLMFIAVEPAYIEALKQDYSLFNYGYDKNVILVSHTTLMPILRTVANLWRIERGNTDAKEIAEKAGEIYNQVCLVADRLNKLGSGLATVTGHFNNTVTALVGQQGLFGKTERFKTLSSKANKIMPNMEYLHQDLDLSRLKITSDNESKE
ncbi:DNA recombination protein RmuC [Rodentibacter caecimuris]|uniref:Recombinase RmuC n=1 Tax=Rodentibacter caecimuris TaxID=1796644 RepID=A0ABX3L3V8_9PAST|nr:recombinase RmuC [Rodentibacter heylii]